MILVSVRLTLKSHAIDSESGVRLVKALRFPQIHVRLTVNRMRSQSIACDFWTKLRVLGWVLLVPENELTGIISGNTFTVKSLPGRSLLLGNDDRKSFLLSVTGIWPIDHVSVSLQRLLELTLISVVLELGLEFWPISSDFLTNNTGWPKSRSRNPNTFRGNSQFGPPITPSLNPRGSTTQFDHIYHL